MPECLPTPEKSTSQIKREKLNQLQKIGKNSCWMNEIEEGMMNSKIEGTKVLRVPGTR